MRGQYPPCWLYEYAKKKIESHDVKFAIYGEGGIVPWAYVSATCDPQIAIPIRAFHHGEFL